MSRVKVEGLRFDTTEVMLEEFFTQYASVTGARIQTDRDTGRPTGSAIVELASAAEAEKAIKLINGLHFGGRTITVTALTPPAPKPKA